MPDEIEDYVDEPDLAFVRCMQRIELASKIVATSMDTDIKLQRRLNHMEERGLLTGQGRYSFRLTAYGEDLANSTWLKRVWLFVDRRVGGPVVAVGIAAGGALLSELLKRLVGWI